LRAYNGFRPFLLQVWALRTVKDRLDAEGRPADLAPFQAQILELRGHCEQIAASMAQPVPFPYYHTLTLMLSLNLLLMAYALIEFETVMTIPSFFMICLIALGLKETVRALCVPAETQTRNPSRAPRNALPCFKRPMTESFSVSDQRNRSGGCSVRSLWRR
jgi:hypothetical protein